MFVNGSLYNSDESIELPSAYLGQDYNEVVGLEIPEFLTIELNGDVIDLPINSIEITGVTMPNGMTYSCSVNECYFGPNTSGDIVLSGTATESGINELVLTSAVSINFPAILYSVKFRVTYSYEFSGYIVIISFSLAE